MAKKKIREATDAKPQEDEAADDEVQVSATPKADEKTSSSKRRERRAANEAGASAGGDEAKKSGDAGAVQPKLLRTQADDPLVKEVVDMILKGIAEPGSQKDGKAFVPIDWSNKYKPTLGPYKKFLLAHPDKFALVEDGSATFTIKRPEDVDSKAQVQAPKVKGTTWQKMLTNAWMAYCLVVPREKRDFNTFLEPLPRAARVAATGTPAAAAVPGKHGEKRKHDAVGKEAVGAEAAPAEAGTKKKKKKRPTEDA